MRHRIFNPTWEALQAEYDAIDVREQREMMSFLANVRPDFEFGTKLGQLYSCTLEEAREHGAPQAVFDTIGTSDGPVDLSFDRPNTLGEGGVVVNHPTLGWFVVNPNANPDTESPVLYHPKVPVEVFGYALLRVLLPCCAGMKNQLDYWCEKHGNDCPDRVVRFSTVPEPEGRWLLVAQNAEWDFEFCPWCGMRFQTSIGEPGHRRLWMPR